MDIKQSYALTSLVEKIGVPIEQNTISVGTIKTSYITTGQGQPVVLVHGAIAGAITWYPIIRSLSNHFTVIAPDIVGYGESDKPSAPYDRPYFTAWLKTFLDALNIQQTHLVGLSQGGPIVIRFTLDNPERVDKLVLVDSAGLGKEIPPGALLGLMWLNTFPSKAAAWWLNRYLVHNKKNTNNAHDEYMIGVCRMPGGKRPFWQGRGKVISPIPPEQLAKITNRTLIISGNKEKFFPVAHSEAASKVMPNAQLKVIPEAAHIPFFEQAENFSDALLQFLKGN
jgi:2-hydroxymuconate-semialdehyde hydrolase